MRKYTLSLIIILSTCIAIFAQIRENVIMLNGTVDFQQTEYAFPPEKFNHKIQVPGLIDLAEPQIEQYDKYFVGKQTPKYSWYKFKFKVSNEYKNDFAVLTILKSRFNTQVTLNGYDCGTHMQCNTPIETNLTPYLKYNNQENILLVRVDEEKRLPRESATGFDREKFANIPGIWDDIFISFTGPVRISRTLILPSYAEQNVKVKLKLENLSKLLQRSMEYAYANYRVTGHIIEKKSGKKASDNFQIYGKVKSQQEEKIEFDVKIPNPIPWTPEDPFLYQAVIEVIIDSMTIDEYGNPENLKPEYPEYLLGNSDKVTENIGVRDFKPVERHFELNGEQYFLAGSTITLNRFFEDRDRNKLPWNKEWVKKMFIDIPKAYNWNAFRICIGLVPDFWYDLADEYGIVLQNEYPMWQMRGSNSQIEKEYKDWVWSDGSHPSIVIWDALNEQKNEFIGGKLIPDLIKLDPSRIWDAGYMKAEDMPVHQMEEIHQYALGFGWWYNDERYSKRFESYRFGSLSITNDNMSKRKLKAAPMLINEYGWLWQTRDGKESAIRTKGEFLPNQETPYTDNYEYYEPGGKTLYSNRDIYTYYLGEDPTVEERIQFNAYMMGIEGEVLRTGNAFAGILSFPYLTNNYGYTGDWWVNDVENLEANQALMVQYHTAARFGVYIDQEDQRYNKNPEYLQPGTTQAVILHATNDTKNIKNGSILFKVIDAEGSVMFKKELSVQTDPFWYKQIPVVYQVPEKEGGYMLLTELTDLSDKDSATKQVSRRYIRVGDIKSLEFYNYIYQNPF